MSNVTTTPATTLRELAARAGGVKSAITAVTRDTDTAMKAGAKFVTEPLMFARATIEIATKGHGRARTR